MAKAQKPSKSSLESEKKAPRVRKVETVRERNEKAMAKAEAKSNKHPKKRARRAASKVWKPLRKPVEIITWPFRTKPVRTVARFLGRIFWPRYFRESWAELKLVTWPSRTETWKLTLAVLVFAIIFGLAAAGTDFVIDKIMQRLIFRS